MARKKKERVLFVDGDLLLYKICCVNTTKTTYGETSVGIDNWQDCVYYFNLSINKLKAKFNTTSVFIFFTDSVNFRKELLPSYKANRTAPKPPQLTSCRKHLVEKGGLMFPRIEADDAIGIYATDPNYKDYEKIIVSADKDFKTIPEAILADPSDTNNLAYAYSPIDSLRWFYTQILTGDTADNYKGCPGIGKVKADKILGSLTSGVEMWRQVVAAYEEKGLTKDDALLQARMARILHFGEYNFKTNRIKLWQPPEEPKQESIVQASNI